MLSNVRRLLLSLLLLVVTVAAQSAKDRDLVVKLISDLLPLKLAVASDEPLKDDVYTSAELQSVQTYSQSQAMMPFGNDLIRFRFKLHHSRPNPVSGGVVLRPFFGPDQSYKLAYVLSGKDLTEANLSPLIEALLGILRAPPNAATPALCSGTLMSFAPLPRKPETRCRLWV